MKTLYSKRGKALPNSEVALYFEKDIKKSIRRLRKELIGYSCPASERETDEIVEDVFGKELTK